MLVRSSANNNNMLVFVILCFCLILKRGAYGIEVCKFLFFLATATEKALTIVLSIIACPLKHVRCFISKA